VTVAVLRKKDEGQAPTASLIYFDNQAEPFCYICQ
jgi:hypothetical protein